jgi:hypothetical protein
MGGAGPRPAGRTPDRVAGRAPDVHSATVCRRAHCALPSLQEASTAALHPCVASLVARHHSTRPSLVGKERAPCALPVIVITPAPRHAQQERHTACHG